MPRPSRENDPLVKREHRQCNTGTMTTKRARFSQPSSPPDIGTYWDTVLAQTDEYPRGCFVAVGFDMWVVWSQIITALRRTANTFNTTFAKIFVPDYDFHGSPSFKNTAPNYGEEVVQHCDR